MNQQNILPPNYMNPDKRAVEEVLKERPMIYNDEMEVLPWWHEAFEGMTKGDDSLGSAGWRVGPATVRTLIRSIEKKARQPLSKDQAFMDMMEKELGVRFIDAEL